MIKSRTYNGQAGLNYIQSSDLAFAIVYVVKREGTQYDKYVSGSTSRTYIFQDSLGRINFPTVFEAGGEKVFVIYKTISGTEPDVIPGVCVPVVYIPDSLQDAKVGAEYTRTYTFTGSSPFTLNIITKPTWAEVFLYPPGDAARHYVRFYGIPTTEGTEDIEFQIGNCGGFPITVTDSFTVYPEESNFTVSKTLMGRINNVEGISYIITSGSFPMIGSSTLTGVHGDYTGTITVSVSFILFPMSLRLIKNGVELEVKPVTGNGDYTFALQSYLSADIIQIILN